MILAPSQIPVGVSDEELDDLVSAGPQSGEGGGSDGDSLLRAPPPSSRRQSTFSPTQRTWLARAWKAVDTR